MCILLYVKIYLVQWYSIDLWSIDGGWGYICPGYMCILLYVKRNWCSSIAQMSGQLEECVLGIRAFFYI